MTRDARWLFELNFPDVDWRTPRWADAESRLYVQRRQRGETVLALGQACPALFGVLGGCVETRFSTAQGDLSVVENVAPGHVFGLASFVTGLPSTYEAIALEPTRLLAIGPDAYAWLMDRVPGFARSLMREFARRHDGTLKLLEAARHRSAEERLCIALQHLRREGRATPGASTGTSPGVRPATGMRAAAGPWTMQVTQSELAARANVSRQTANEWLATWAAQGWIERRYRGLSIARWPVAIRR